MLILSILRLTKFLLKNFTATVNKFICPEMQHTGPGHQGRVQLPLTGALKNQR